MIEFFTEYPIFLWLIEIAYLTGIIFLSVKIILDTQNVSKTLGYLLLITFVPIIGIIIYFLFGVNFRKNKFYTFKIKKNQEVYNEIRKFATNCHEETIKNLSTTFQNSLNTIQFLYKASESILTNENQVELLFNGEEKFKKLFEIIKKAKHHIHLE